MNKIRILARIAADKEGVTTDDILGPSGRHKIAHPRQRVMAAARALGMTHPQIGAAVGRDHTTVMFGVRAVARRNEQDKVEAILREYRYRRDEVDRATAKLRRGLEGLREAFA